MNPNPLPHPSGFTLVELLVVVAILAVAVAVAAPGVGRIAAPREERSATKQLVAAIAQSRDQAIRRKAAFFGSMNIDDGTWRDASQNIVYPVRDSLQLLPLVPGAPTRIPCTFMPDGSGCSLSFRIVDRDGQWLLRVDPITGRTLLFRDTSSETSRADAQTSS